MSDWFSNNHDAPAAAGAHEIRVGDIVRIGSGSKLWRVDQLWQAEPAGKQLANLDALDDYGWHSAAADRLTLVDRPVNILPDGIQEATC